MNGVIARALAATCVVGAVMAGGCTPLRNLVDICYPERYNATARREVVDCFAPQVQNGHVLDQTIWSYDFDTGTDRLNKVGIEKLKYLARRRPAPDPNLFLATATDVDYDADHPEKMAQMRQELDARRVVAIRKYLSTYMDGRQMSFDVMIHDPYEVGYNAIYASSTAQRLNAGSASGPLGTLSGGAIGATAAGGYGGYGAYPGGPNQTGQFGYGPPGAAPGTGMGYGPAGGYAPGGPGTGVPGGPGTTPR